MFWGHGKPFVSSSHQARHQAARRAVPGCALGRRAQCGDFFSRVSQEAACFHKDRTMASRSIFGRGPPVLFDTWSLSRLGSAGGRKLRDFEHPCLRLQWKETMQARHTFCPVAIVGFLRRDRRMEMVTLSFQPESHFRFPPPLFPTFSAPNSHIPHESGGFWVWVKINPPGIGPQVVVIVYIYPKWVPFLGLPYF